MSDRSDFDDLAEEKYGDKFTSLTDDAADDLYERYEEKYETFGDEKLALTAAVGSFNFDENMEGSSGEVDIIGVGTNGPRPFGDGPALFCYGIVIPEDGKAGRIVIIVNHDDVEGDLENYVDYFRPYEAINAEISHRSSDKVSGVHEGSEAYIGEIPNSTTDPFELRDTDRTEEEREELVKDHVDAMSVADVSESLSLRDNGYTAAFGLDFKRLDDAVTLNARISANGARYVFQDDSFLDPEELSPEVRGEDNDIGLVAWCEPNQATFDQESIVDVYGTVTPNDEGHITMRMYGATEAVEGSIIPAEAPADTSSSGSSSSQSSDSGSSGESAEAVEERKI